LEYFSAFIFSQTHTILTTHIKFWHSTATALKLYTLAGFEPGTYVLEADAMITIATLLGPVP
jgi:hypothetical protein